MQKNHLQDYSSSKVKMRKSSFHLLLKQNQVCNEIPVQDTAKFRHYNKNKPVNTFNIDQS